MPSFKEFVDTKFVVKMAKPQKYHKINPKSNRMKTFKKVRHLSTSISPENRTMKNMPKYANGKSKVNFQDWLEIAPGDRKNGHGKAANGKHYGWSHRAVYGFGAGDDVKGDSLGKKVEYSKLPDGDMDCDNGKFEDDFKIKDDNHAAEVAKIFHDNVA